MNGKTVAVAVAKTAVLVVGGIAAHSAAQGVRKGTDFVYGRLFGTPQISTTTTKKEA
jgi:hypothetical protein